jgi:hypothetical protein
MESLDGFDLMARVPSHHTSSPFSLPAGPFAFKIASLSANC